MSPREITDQREKYGLAQRTLASQAAGLGARYRLPA